VQIRTQAMHEEAELGGCAIGASKGKPMPAVVSSNAYEEQDRLVAPGALEWHEEMGDIGGIGLIVCGSIRAGPDLPVFHS